MPISFVLFLIQKIKIRNRITKLAPVTPIATRMAIGKDIETGMIVAEEYGKQIKGQMSLRDFESEKVVIDEDVVDAATGEVTGKVIDLRKINEA